MKAIYVSGTLLAISLTVHAGPEPPITEGGTGPIEYVRVCDTYGSSFYYIPGTETCLRIGPHIKANLDGGPAFGAGSAFGYHSNPAEEISPQDRSSWYARPYLAGGWIGGTEEAYWYFGGVYSATFYDSEVINREQDNQTVHDLQLRAGLKFRPTPGFGFWSDNTFDYVGHLGHRFGAHKFGLANDQVLKFHSENEVLFRFDGQDLASPGLIARLRASYIDYAGEKFNYWDFNRYSVTGGLRYNYNDTDSIGLFLSHADKQWRRWDRYDSRSFLGGIELEGNLPDPCGARYDFRTGFECRDYDDSLLPEREWEPFAHLSIGGNPTPELYVGWEGSYGLSNYYNNFGGPAFIDARSFRSALQARYTLGEWAFNGSIAHQWLDPQIMSTNWSSIERTTLSVGADWALPSGWQFGSSVGYTEGDYGFGGNDEFDGFFAQLRVQRTF